MEPSSACAYMQGMTDNTADKPAVSAAKRALELKRAAGAKGMANPVAGRRQTEAVAAARSASKSNPKMRK